MDTGESDADAAGDLDTPAVTILLDRLEAQHRPRAGA